MSKVKAVYICQSCQYESVRWQGQCPSCQAWNTFSEKVLVSTPASSIMTASVTAFQDIVYDPDLIYETGLPEFDRVLGGGLVQGAVILIGGDPGIGKSTLLLQVAAFLQSRGHGVLYVSGEESLSQIGLRAKRLSIHEPLLSFLSEGDLSHILNAVQSVLPDVLIIDSIQTMVSAAASGAAGSVSQVKECAAQLVKQAKHSGRTTFIIGHVNKEGAIAGPRVLEHMVDTVLYFEGDAHSPYRLIRSFKNRFGAVHEIGLFAMTDKGLRVVKNPSALFLSQQTAVPVSGTSIVATNEASRTLLVEIQALVVDTPQHGARRLIVGLDHQRIHMLLAILSRHGHCACLDKDVFVNVVGGMRIMETAADLAVLLAVVSSLRSQSLPPLLVIFGELGLTGEVRPVSRGQERLREAHKLGFQHAIMPAANAPKQDLPGMSLYPVSTVSEALKLFVTLTHTER